MSNPQDLLYSKSHEWLRVEGAEAYIGITHFAQEALGDITYVDLPAVGDTLTAGKELGSIESVKAASELYAPVSGTVSAVNEALADAPDLVNKDPYGQAWLLRITLTSPPAGLMDAAAYEAHCAAEQ